MSEPTQEEIEAEIARQRELILRFGRDFFAGTRSKEQTFKRLWLCLHGVSEVVASVAKRGQLTVEEAGNFQLMSCAVSGILHALEGSPMYDTPELEDQLLQGLRHMLKAHTAAQQFKPPDEGGG